MDISCWWEFCGTLRQTPIWTRWYGLVNNISWLVKLCLVELAWCLAMLATLSTHVFDQKPIHPYWQFWPGAYYSQVWVARSFHAPVLSRVQRLYKLIVKVQSSSVYSLVFKKEVSHLKTTNHTKCKLLHNVALLQSHLPHFANTAPNPPLLSCISVYRCGYRLYVVRLVVMMDL